MLTYQDFEAAPDKSKFILEAIQGHKSSLAYKTAVIADAYDHQKNITVNDYVQTIFSLTGDPLEDFTASNAKIASNFFNRCCTQRVNYLLGNGVSFTQHIEKHKGEDGVEASTDTTKEALGPKFDTDLKRVVYAGFSQGESFGYSNNGKILTFHLTDFVPLCDENNGALRAGIHFWQLDTDRPMIAELYEAQGVTKYKQEKGSDKMVQQGETQPYKTILSKAPVEDAPEVIGTENYDGKLPIIPFWGSRLHQSVIIGKQQTIDSYDLINSGFANDITDCSQIYWIVENCGAMKNAELAQLRDRLRLLHIGTADTRNGGSVKPYTMEIPYEARKTMLEGLRAQIYEDFCCLDVHTIAAGATNDHIDAGYQPLDDATDDLEYQVIEFIQQLLALQGIEDTPTFKRNRISNQREQTDMVLSAADHLDEETLLSKLPWISPDEIAHVIARRDAEDGSRFKPDEIIEEEIV